MADHEVHLRLLVDRVLCLWKQWQRDAAELHGLDMHVPVGTDVRYHERQLRADQLHARLREQRHVQRLVRVVVQPEVRGRRHVRHDARRERQRELLGELDLSYPVYRLVHAVLRERLDVRSEVSQRQRAQAGHGERDLSVGDEGVPRSVND